MAARTGVFVVYVGVLLAVAGALVAEPWINLRLPLALFGVPVLVVLSLVALLTAVWKPTRQSLLGGGLALVAAVGLVTGASTLMMAGERLYVRLERPRLDRLVATALAEPRLWEMSDGTRYWKTVNRHPVAYSAGEIDTACVAGRGCRRPVGAVLAALGVPLARYDALCRQLRALHVIEYEVSPDTVILVSDGLVDRLHGWLYVRPGRPVPRAGDAVLGGRALTGLTPLGHGWYSFSTGGLAGTDPASAT